MPTLPPAERLLGDVLRLRPYTLEGQWEAARMVQHLVHEYALGKAEILKYSLQASGGEPHYPMVKVLSELGPSNGNRKTMTWLGHVDTVEPHPEQLKQDPLGIHYRDVDDKRTMVGEGRGAIDMWPGNLAYLYALEMLRDSGSARHVIQTLLTSHEEAGSEVLDQAIENGDIEPSPIGATTEILVGDDGNIAQVYRGRTGRIGIEAYFHGKAEHSGSADRNPNTLERCAHRIFGRSLDELLDPERGFGIVSPYPGDAEGALPKKTRVIPGSLRADPLGLSLPDTVYQHFDLFHSNPHLEPATAVAALQDYLKEAVKPNLERGISTFRYDIAISMDDAVSAFRKYHESITAQHREFLSSSYGPKLHELHEPFTLRLENRRGGRFTDPWLMPSDHPLIKAAHGYACDIQKKTPDEFPTTTGSGVAEEGMLAKHMNMKFVGWAPLGTGAHTHPEWVAIDSIMQRAEWLKRLASHDGDLE